MNRKTFTELYAQNKERLLNAVMGMTRNRDAAEDVVAATFVSALKHLEDFRGEAGFYTWLFRIAVHQVIAWRRSPTNRVASLDASEAREPVEPDLLIQTLEHRECCQKIRKALKRIPVMYRRMLVDHFVRGLSTQRIAQIERIPMGTVLSRLFRARQLLRQAWKQMTATETLLEALS